MRTAVHSVSPSHEGASGNPLQDLRNPLVRNSMVVVILLWLVYSVSGFRLPTSPIVLSDSDAGSGIRQLIFGGAGIMAAGFLFLYRGIAPTVALRFPYLALAFFLLGSALWSQVPSLTIKRSAIFIFGLLTLIVIVHSAKNPVRLMFLILVYSSGAFAFLSLLFHITLPQNCTVNPGRAGLAGISVHPNTLAPFLSTGLLLSLGLVERNNRSRLLLRGTQLITVIALFLTGSITTIITTFVGLGFYLILSSGKYRLGLLQILCVSAILFVGVIGLDTLRVTFFDTTGRDESLSGRDELWKAVGYEISMNPILGNGYGAFWTEGKGREITQTWNPRQSHHAYLDVMLDIGTVGLIAVIILFPLTLLFRWTAHSGCPGTVQRRAMAAMYATAFSYLTIYAFGQSYLLRFDSFPFLVLVWISLLVSNNDSNRIDHELPLNPTQ